MVFDGSKVDPRVHSDFLNEQATLAAGLRWRFRWFGVLNWILAVGILLFRLAYFVFHHSDSLRKSAGPLAARQWSPYACYLLRNYSEVEHVFRQRIARSLAPANKYVNMFVSETLSLWARFVVFVVGGVFVALTMLGLIYDEDFLFANLTHGRSVIWWTGILGIILAASQSVIPKEEAQHGFKEALNDVVAVTGSVSHTMLA